MRQEFPTTPEEAFVTSGKKLFDQLIVALHKERYGRQPLETIGKWKIYEWKLAGHYYAMGADTSEGIGREANTAVIWDFTYRPKVVATYRNDSIAPDAFAFELKEMGNKYG